jgi:uncharacterized membrane protein YraQ (UPF0718 family)
MSLIYRKEGKAKKEEQMNIVPPPEKRPMWQTSFHFFTLVLILVFANWGAPTGNDTASAWYFLWHYKWLITGAFGLALAWSLISILRIDRKKVFVAVTVTAVSAVAAGYLIPDPKLSPLLPMLIGIGALAFITLKDHNDPDNREWALSSWGFAKQILPLLAIGVVTAGFLLGSTHDGKSIAGVIPNEWISVLVGGNSVLSNFFASFVGAFMYFATLTEVPILQGLIASGMGKGPALALLLAGPSLSLPNMLVIRGVIGTGKTISYVSIVIVLSTLAGFIYGII